MVFVYDYFNIYFNPHHRTGGDVDIIVTTPVIVHFNPHHRTGGDNTALIEQINQSKISIHTTARVVTCTRQRNLSMIP